MLSVARIKAQARNVCAPFPTQLYLTDRTTCFQTEADAEAYSTIAAAKAVAERTRIEAEAQAHATRLAAEAEAEATRIKARADADVGDSFAQEMGRRRQEVARVAAFGNKAVFVPTEAMGVAVPSLAGMAAGLGADLRK